jgi:UDP-glucose 6-dehydrogenase
MLKSFYRFWRATFTLSNQSIRQALQYHEATPPGEGYKADLRAVFAVAETVAQNADHDLIFVNKSTVPVGTGLECEKRIAKILKDRNVSFKIPGGVLVAEI